MDDAAKPSGNNGAPSGELFVRVNSAAICYESGLLHGARPFLMHEVLLPSCSIVQQLRPWTQKIALARRLRAQIKARREQTRVRWKSVQTAIDGVSVANAHCLLGSHSSSGVSNERRTERYVDSFLRLEQLHNQFVMQSVLRFYALLEAERTYIQQWSAQEDAKCQDLLKQTQLLFHFNLFATQLESETLGQVRMWRLPASDSQHQRCVKAASENVKRNFFSSPHGQQLQQPSLEVMEVYKIENRPLLHHFHCFTQAMPSSEVKIKGLFCTVPNESIEHCVVWGMHHDGESFRAASAEDIEVFSRAALGNMDGIPGTSHEFRAKLKVSESKVLKFPRRFSRYSTFEESRGSLTTQDGTTENSSITNIQYLALCRVAMGKIVRVKKDAVGCEGDADSFPEDPLVGTLYFAEEEEYLVRYPQAVVPEFVVQLRWSQMSSGSPRAFPDPVMPVTLAEPSIELLSAAFERQSYTMGLNSSSPSGLLCGYGTADNSTSVFAPHDQVFKEEEDEVELLEKNLARAAKARAAAALAKLSAESVLANCARQKKLVVEDLRSLQRLFWSRSHELWASSGAEMENGKSQRNPNPERQQDQQLYQHQQNGFVTMEKPAAAHSSAKAQKLLGDLERVRQLETSTENNATTATFSSKPKAKRNPNVGRPIVRNNYYPAK